MHVLLLRVGPDGQKDFWVVWMTICMQVIQNQLFQSSSEKRSVVSCFPVYL